MSRTIGHGVQALVVAAGRGLRFGGALPKQYGRLAGRPVLRHAVEALARHPAVDAVRVVIHPDDRALYDEAVAGLTLAEPVAGGATRAESVRNGLEALAWAAPRHVLIHDGARPMVDAGLVSRVLAALDSHCGAVPAVPVADTLKRSDADADAPRVAATVPRAGLWQAQTPQMFRYGVLARALADDAALACTDEAQAVEAAGYAPRLVRGSPANLKITFPDDLALAAAILAAQAREEA